MEARMSIRGSLALLMVHSLLSGEALHRQTSSLAISRGNTLETPNFYKLRGMSMNSCYGRTAFYAVANRRKQNKKKPR